jgi:hypothetical protein
MQQWRCKRKPSLSSKNPKGRRSSQYPERESREQLPWLKDVVESVCCVARMEEVVRVRKGKSVTNLDLADATRTLLSKPARTINPVFNQSIWEKVLVWNQICPVA